MNRARLNILSFTTLFPNRSTPFHGLFVKNRLERLARLCNLEVVAPVNIARDPRLAWTVPMQEIIGGIPVHHPRFAVLPGLFKHWDGSLLYRHTLRQMRGSAPLERCDLIDVHYAYPDGVAGQLLAQTLGKPFVLSLRGSDIHVLAQFPKRRALIRMALARASRIIAVSQALKDEARQLGADPAKIHVIPNGVDTLAFFPRDRQEARRTLGWPAGRRALLFVGRLSRIKGLDLLVNALALVRERGLFLHGHIVGDGELRPELERTIARHRLQEEVTLHGWVAPTDLPRWYSAADLVCLPSRSEGCPNVVVEAMACGTPVVATAVGGVPDLVREQVSGLLIRERSAAAIADGIEQACARPWSPVAVHTAAAAQDWSAVAAAQMQLFHDVVGR